jgi:hypothetical protein
MKEEGEEEEHTKNNNNNNKIIIIILMLLLLLLLLLLLFYHCRWAPLRCIKEMLLDSNHGIIATYVAVILLREILV